MDVAELAARKIMDDVYGRKGLGNELEQTDSAVRDEILVAWTEIIRETVWNAIAAKANE